MSRTSSKGLFYQDETPEKAGGGVISQGPWTHTFDGLHVEMRANVSEMIEAFKRAAAPLRNLTVQSGRGGPGKAVFQTWFDEPNRSHHAQGLAVDLPQFSKDIPFTVVPPPQLPRLGDVMTIKGMAGLDDGEYEVLSLNDGSPMQGPELTMRRIMRGEINMTPDAVDQKLIKELIEYKPPAPEPCRPRWDDPKSDPMQDLIDVWEKAKEGGTFSQFSQFRSEYLGDWNWTEFEESPPAPRVGGLQSCTKHGDKYWKGGACQRCLALR